MLDVFLISFSLMIVVILIMAVGYIFQKKEIKGSCGGITALGMDKVCDCDDPCDDKKERMRKEAARNQEEISISNL
ncbi:(Na+)-NQR maturation NqrM [Pleionea sp. CnH1-48]|uniref:(Na+)-NQR maturation NqrM n=1 Tax=Pleionea sp. CnH1-48 TaxID=2954494 RepID=UPI002097F9E5|nr:(Na+)-NQR maturation NqrM [Pleionea sp. CnH1-48]MCO7225081.1 (Na+)-NQR maturation NqrM [Pleionea sp. CnH1-48]